MDKVQKKYLNVYFRWLLFTSLKEDIIVII